MFEFQERLLWTKHSSSTTRDAIGYTWSGVRLFESMWRRAKFGLEGEHGCPQSFIQCGQKHYTLMFSFFAKTPMANLGLHSCSPSSIYRHIIGCQQMMEVDFHLCRSKELLSCLNYIVVDQRGNIPFAYYCVQKVYSKSIFGDKRWLPISFSCGNFK